MLGFALAAWMTPRAPSWAFFLLPTRMGELLAGALLAVVGTQITRIPAVARAALAWIGLAVIVVACVRFDEAMPWPGTAVLVPVLATMAVIVGGSADRRCLRGLGRCCSGSAGTPTPCTSGTGRCSCSPMPGGDRSTGPSASSPW